MQYLGRVNDPHDLELVTPEENPDHPGFYYYPDDRRISVNKIGEVLNNKTGRVLKPHLNTKSNELSVVFTTPGIKHANYRVHRIIARTFIGRPSRHLDKKFSKLEVNHIDGNRSNNALENLEWVTGKENAQHAHHNGFHTLDTPVLSKNLKTGVVKFFASGKNCAEHYGIHRATLFKHLNSKNAGMAHKDGHVFKYDDGSEWKECTIKDLRPLGDRVIDILVRNTVNNFISFFSSLKEAAKVHNVPYVTLWRKLKNRSRVHIGDLEFTLLKNDNGTVVLNDYGEVLLT